MIEAFTLVVFASWEDRFREGLLRFLPSDTPSTMIMFYYDERAPQTEANRTVVKKLCENLKVPVTERQLSANDVPRNWLALRETLTSVLPGSRVVVDVSTMPREIIWITLWFLDLINARTEYIYHRPATYGEWQSRDPQRPRLVYKMSGLTRFAARTAIVVVAGYDVDRTGQLISFYEPAVTLLGLQRQDEGMSEITRRHLERFGRQSTVTTFEIDAYSADHGQGVVEKQMSHYMGSHNIIMSSLGPKLSAVALYRIHRAHRDLGLAYTPSREFNPLYSSGLGAMIRGSL